MEIKLTKDNFDAEVMNSDKPVLIDFWATWCGPCQMLSPIIAEIAEEYADKIKVGKVNVDEEAELAYKFHVASIPMLVLMKDGEIVKKDIGYMPKEEVIAMFE